MFHEAQKRLTKAKENDEFRLVEEMCELEALGSASGYVVHESLGEMLAMEVIGEEQDLTTGSRAAKNAELKQIIFEQDLSNVRDNKRTSIGNNYATKRRGDGHSSYKKTQNLTQ